MSKENEKQLSIDEQLAEATLLEKKADLKIKLAKLKELDAADAKKEMTAEMREEALEDFNAKQDGEKSSCNHMKGGMDGEGKLGTGDDNKNHCVVLNRDPIGTTYALCTRCQGNWFPGDTREVWAFTAANFYAKKRIKFRNPTGKSYEDALRMAAQSNNRQMSSITFEIRKNGQVVNSVSA